MRGQPNAIQLAVMAAILAATVVFALYEVFFG